MNENVAVPKIWATLIGIVLTTLILTVGAYNITDRIEQGHTVITTGTVVTK